MTINELIEILNRAKDTVGGETQVEITDSNYGYDDSDNVCDIVVRGTKSFVHNKSSDEDTKLHIVYGG